MRMQNYLCSLAEPDFRFTLQVSHGLSVDARHVLRRGHRLSFDSRPGAALKAPVFVQFGARSAAGIGS